MRPIPSTSQIASQSALNYLACQALDSRKIAPYFRENYAALRDFMEQIGDSLNSLDFNCIAVE
jgi:hypothetical protein